MVDESCDSQHAVEMRGALEGLIEWAAQMGGWEAPCWRHAREALDGAREAVKFDRDRMKCIERAREVYAVGSDDDIEIDDNALLSEAHDGRWVQAWVWIGDPDEDDDDEKGGAD